MAYTVRSKGTGQQGEVVQITVESMTINWGSHTAVIPWQEFGGFESVEQDPVTAKLAEELADAGFASVDQPKLGTGRSGTGRLRNFTAMSDEKLMKTMDAVRDEGDDDEALDAMESEAVARGLL